MPWLFFFAALFAVVAAGFLLVTRRAPDRDIRSFGVLGAIVCGTVAAFLVVMSCIATVSTRNVGIVIEFGKPVGTLSNGFHLKAPWAHVPELNGTIQTDSATGGFVNGVCSGGTPVRLANNSTACVDNTVRWRIAPSAGDALYRDYQNDNNIRDSLVTRELSASLNEVFAAYNPLSPDAAAGPNLTELGTRATDTLRRRVGAQIEIQNVILSLVHFDPETQAKINAYQSQLADKNIAQARQGTAAADAQANRLLADSVSRDPNVLVSKCLDMINAGRQVPTGFQCWPGAGLPVTIPAR
jgi:regulator of protease activity HflC (stomatin/prohibitin superfamily)